MLCDIDDDKRFIGLAFTISFNFAPLPWLKKQRNRMNQTINHAKSGLADGTFLCALNFKLITCGKEFMVCSCRSCILHNIEHTTVLVVYHMT